MNPPLIFERDNLPQKAIQALASEPLNFLEELAFVEKQKKAPAPWETAGVLLLLYFEEKKIEGEFGEYVFLLNKRSEKVPQAGDLCAPGGGMHVFWDFLLQKALQLGVLPWAKGPAQEIAKKKEKKLYEKILLFLGSALRETWEEIHLSPGDVEFWGALPAYRLLTRRWIIFPMVGRVQHLWTHKLNWEVDKIVSIPLQNFYNAENYAIYRLQEREEQDGGNRSYREFPCLIHKQSGEEEILWGATFYIIRSFLKIVIPDPLPLPDGRRVISKTLRSDYLAGKRGL